MLSEEAIKYSKIPEYILDEFRLNLLLSSKSKAGI
jgi:hypothetical protein